MKTTTVRDIPDDVYEVIVKKAKQERRSINSQLIIALVEYAKQLKAQDRQEEKTR